MKVPFSWKPTGWFMFGWSADFPSDEVRPLQYFGEDLVAYRDDTGSLHLLNAHCPHLGAHIGHGGRVVGDCVECPYHGWGWGPDGVNRYIPYEDQPNRARRLRAWPVMEQYGCVFLWHDPHGRPPRWDMPDIFLSFPQADTDPGRYYRPYPEMSRRSDREPVHPQVVAENGPDSIHFQRVHRASVTPKMLEYEAVDQEWRFFTGWPDTRNADPDAMALRIRSHLFGLGGAISMFEGVSNHRLIFAVTPVDDTCSNMFYSVWWPRIPGDDSEVPPQELQDRIDSQFMVTIWEDLEIWRYQKYVEHPALAKQDAQPYKNLRQWSKQFYEDEPTVT